MWVAPRQWEARTICYRPTPKQSKIGVTNNSYARNASARATVSSTSTACASMTGNWGNGNASLSTLWLGAAQYQRVARAGACRIEHIAQHRFVAFQIELATTFTIVINQRSDTGLQLVGRFDERVSGLFDGTLVHAGFARTHGARKPTRGKRSFG